MTVQTLEPAQTSADLRMKTAMASVTAATINVQTAEKPGTIMRTGSATNAEIVPTMRMRIRTASAIIRQNVKTEIRQLRNRLPGKTAIMAEDTENTIDFGALCEVT